MIQTKGKATFVTQLNLQTQNAYNININAPFTVAKWWTGNLNFNGFYLGFKSDSLLGGNLNKGKAAFQAKALNTFTIGNGFRAELSGDYQSPLVYGVFNIKPQYAVDAGLSKTFLNKKLNAKFSVSDIFNTRTNNLTSNYTNTNIAIYQKRDSRVALLTLTYNFGNSKLAPARRHKSGADDEKNRVKSGG